MKKLLLLLTLITGLMFNAKASHDLGGEITYEWISANSYNIKLTTYTDCMGIPAPASKTISYSSSCTGMNTIPLTLSSWTNISQVCDTMQLACYGGTLPGVIRTTYEGTITTMSACSDWVLSYSSCCRNNLPMNVVSPGTTTMYLETTLDNTSNLNNESPYFVDLPRWMIPVNQTSYINAGAYDENGDSLYFSLVAPQNGVSGNVSFQAGFTGTQPFVSNPATSINPQTGIITTTPTVIGMSLINVKVDEYRNGQYIGYVIREFNTNVINGMNTLPSITNSTLNFTVCNAPDSFNTNIFSFDVADSITTSILDGHQGTAFFTNTTFPWNENTNYLNDINNFWWSNYNWPTSKTEHIVYVNVQDDQCPIPGIQSYAIIATVESCTPGACYVDIPQDTITACQTSVQLQTVSITGHPTPTTYLWSPTTGLSDPGIANPIITQAHDQTYVVTMVDGSGCISKDSVVVNAYNPVFDTSYICAPDSVVLDFGPGATNYYWQTFTDVSNNSSPLFDTTQTIWASEAGEYFGYAAFPVCGALTSLFTVVDSCMLPDSVWPGDANADLIADIYDVLPIGIYYGQTGTVRAGASTNWNAQWSADWGTTQGAGADIKHADCEGDGTIDVNDVTPIALNYGLTHTKGILDNSSKGPNDPMLYVDIALDTFPTSTPMIIPIKLGTVTIPADSVYGIAMTITYDNTLIDSIAGITVDYSTSWLGTEGVDMITLDTNFYDNGRIDIGLVRTDGQMMSGFDDIFTLGIVTADNLSGKTFIYDTLIFDFDNVVIIDNVEDLRLFNQEPDSVVIEDGTNGIDDEHNNNMVHIVPNPNKGSFNVHITDFSNSTVEIYNAVGQLIETTSSRQSGYVNIDMQGANKGLYFVRVLNKNKATKVEKVVIH